MFEQIFLFDGIPFNAETGHYLPLLAVLSYVVASLASYTALDLAVNIVKARNLFLKKLMHYGGSFAMGAGIWSMHFIGMLAYKMDMYVEYDPVLTVLSIVPAFIVSYFVLDFVKKGQLDFKYILLGGVLLGFGICAMHYTGMAAMVMDSDVRYIPSLFSLSAVIAVSASAVALLIAFSLAHRVLKYAFLLKIVAALIMGAAICGMHYTGMAATVFIPWADCRYDPSQSFTTLALSIAAITTVILLMTLTLMAYSHKKAISLVSAILDKHIVPVLVIFSLIGASAIFLHVIHFEKKLVESMTLESAENLSEILTEFRSLYTSEVVVSAKAAGLEVTHDYTDKEHAIPLPATFSMLLGDRLSERLDRVIRLYSPYPFPWRKDEGGLQDDFSVKAKKAFINKVFALDVTSLSVTTSAVCADIDFLGGSSIHESVEKPNNIYRFMHQDLFTDILTEQHG